MDFPDIEKNENITTFKNWWNPRHSSWWTTDTKLIWHWHQSGRTLTLLVWEFMHQRSV